MRSHLRFTALAAVAVACLACWCARPAPDWSLARELLRECRRAEALERREEQIRRLNEAKGAVTAEVLAGRMTLAEAACRFGEAEEALGDDAFLCTYQRVTGEQGLSRNVLIWVGATVDRGPGRVATLARLKGEHRQRFGESPPRPMRCGRGNGGCPRS
jgi:hypothetical protein